MALDPELSPGELGDLAGLLRPIIAQGRLSSEYLWFRETVSHAIFEASLFLYDLFGESLWVEMR